MGLVGLDRMVLHTVMHPYFNQTWGFFAMPFVFVLAWWAVEERTRGGVALLRCSPRSCSSPTRWRSPIPLIPLGVVLWPERRAAAPEAAALYNGPPLAAVDGPASPSSLLLPLGGLAEVRQRLDVVLNPTARCATGAATSPATSPSRGSSAIDSYFALVSRCAPAALRRRGWRSRPSARRCARAARRSRLRRRVRASGSACASTAGTSTSRRSPSSRPVALTSPSSAWPRSAIAGWRSSRCRLLAAPPVSAATSSAAPSTSCPGTLELRSIDRALPPGASVRLDIAARAELGRLHAPRPAAVLAEAAAEHVLPPRPRLAQGRLHPHHVRRPRPADAAGAPVTRLEAYTLWRQSRRSPAGPTARRRWSRPSSA